LGVQHGAGQTAPSEQLYQIKGGCFEMDEQNNRSVIVDIDIPFSRLVMILIKVSLASIPAVIVV
jgi:hypothetical protein